MSANTSVSIVTKKRPLIYVSGPYRAATKDGVLQNILGAWKDAVKLWRAGAAVICPHTNTTDPSVYSRDHGITPEEFIEGDLVMIERCDAIYMREDWRTSKGAREELKHANILGIPAYFNIDDLLLAIRKETVTINDFKELRAGTVGRPSPQKSALDPSILKKMKPDGGHSSIFDFVPTSSNSVDKFIRKGNLPGNPKDAAGSSKTPFHLVPESATAQEAEVMRLGASKYGAYNWRTKAVKASVYVSALRRHLAAWFDRKDNDPESGLSHLAHARANLGILLDAEHVGQLIDDRPSPGGTLAPMFPATLDSIQDQVRRLRYKVDRATTTIEQLEEKADELRSSL